MGNGATPLHLFEGYGVELEYMLVKSDTLEVLAAADRVLSGADGLFVNEAVHGAVTWSNELALHVLEFKPAGPVQAFEPLVQLFSRSIEELTEVLGPMNGMAMPGGMHPFMNPATDLRLWPHEYSPIYTTFDGIFNCRRHGWANLQSLHLNLPFYGDEEFGRLHAAIRIVLPLLPAIAASSPIAEGRCTGMLDTRMDMYQSNSILVPSITGDLIPEPIFTMWEYEEEVLEKIYRDLKPHDPEGLLQEEWVNARGAIPRFERNTIEIRIIDVQEHPAADIAVAALVTALVRGLVEERFAGWERQKTWRSATLREILTATIRDGEGTLIDNTEYLRLFGFHRASVCTSGVLWSYLIERLWKLYPSLLEPHQAALSGIIRNGTLATRILRACGKNPDRSTIEYVYRQLCRCLAQGKLFE
jgi:glutamate---cysteine ligase / carboxylate-amine ligase